MRKCKRKGMTGFLRSELLTVMHSCAVLLPVHLSMNKGPGDNILMWVCYTVYYTLIYTVCTVSYIQSFWPWPEVSEKYFLLTQPFLSHKPSISLWPQLRNWLQKTQAKWDENQAYGRKRLPCPAWYLLRLWPLAEHPGSCAGLVSQAGSAVATLVPMQTTATT